jgi:DegV family protein with EDD domain
MERAPIAVVTDSAASLPERLASELGIEVVPLYLRLGDETLRDGADVDRFYDRLRAGEAATTASPGPGDFLEAYGRTGAPEIVCVTIASSVSGILQSATVAAEMAEARVEVVDSGNASMGEGFVALEAARAARAGGSLDEVATRAREVASRAQLVAAIDTFDHLRRSGRVNRLVSYAGTMLGIKPVFRLAGGSIDPVARPRTRRRALDRLAEEAEAALAGCRSHLAAVHAAAEDDARELLERVVARVEPVESFLSAFTPAMGVHTGPGVVGLAFFCD